mmetsp:Transcript_19588/g.61143  ORF Transcript_19588/g.61143 Transcript_19588/m.61143 type:complete len:252 (-) Transcript_19588:295-1050(-)
MTRSPHAAAPPPPAAARLESGEVHPRRGELDAELEPPPKLLHPGAAPRGAHRHVSARVALVARRVGAHEDVRGGELGWRQQVRLRHDDVEGSLQLVERIHERVVVRGHPERRLDEHEDGAEAAGALEVVAGEPGPRGPLLGRRVRQRPVPGQVGEQQHRLSAVRLGHLKELHGAGPARPRGDGGGAGAGLEAGHRVEQRRLARVRPPRERHLGHRVSARVDVVVEVWERVAVREDAADERSRAVVGPPQAG